MAKRGRPPKVAVAPAAPKPVMVLVDDGTGKPKLEPMVTVAAPPPPNLEKEQLDILTRNVQQKLQHIKDVQLQSIGETGLAADGTATFGNALDGLTPQAIQQLKDMAGHEGFEKVGEIFTQPKVAPAQLILPQGTPGQQAQMTQTQTVTPAIDVMDIFGIK